MKLKSATLFVSLAVVLALSIVLATSVCSASSGRYNDLPKEDVAIGGITIGTDESYVRKVYGDPDKITHTDDSRRAGPTRTKTFTYGTTFIIVFNEENNRVWELKSTGNNGLKTPAGIAVGMNLSNVYNRYGLGRAGDDFVAYTSDWRLNIMFKSDNNGKITEIYIYPTP